MRAKKRRNHFLENVFLHAFEMETHEVQHSVPGVAQESLHSMDDIEFRGANHLDSEGLGWSWSGMSQKRIVQHD